MEINLVHISILCFVLLVYGFAMTKKLLKQHEKDMQNMQRQIDQYVNSDLRNILKTLLEIEKENNLEKNDKK